MRRAQRIPLIGLFVASIWRQPEAASKCFTPDGTPSKGNLLYIQSMTLQGRFGLLGLFSNSGEQRLKEVAEIRIRERTADVEWEKREMKIFIQNLILRKILKKIRYFRYPSPNYAQLHRIPM
jgi:hypothetical protein